MTIKKETIDGVDYVRKDVLVGFLDKLYRICIAEGVKTGDMVYPINAGAMSELRDFIKEL